MQSKIRQRSKDFDAAVFAPFFGATGAFFVAGFGNALAAGEAAAFLSDEEAAVFLIALVLGAGAAFSLFLGSAFFAFAVALVAAFAFAMLTYD